jgi:phage terminase small subunit
LKSTGLKPKEQRFADEYLTDYNGSAAYVRAGYKVKNANVAGVQAFKMLRKPKIEGYIRKRQLALQKELFITQGTIMRELAKCAFSNIGDFVEFKAPAPSTANPSATPPTEIPVGDVMLKDWSKLSRDHLAAVSQITITREGGVKFKLHDKKGPLELLGKQREMFAEKHEVTGKDGAPLVPQIVKVVIVNEHRSPDEK